MKILTQQEQDHFKSLSPDELIQLSFDLKEVILNNGRTTESVEAIKSECSVDVAGICKRKRPV